MYVVFRRYVDADVVTDLLRAVRGFVSHCLRLRRRREPAAATVCDIQAGTQESNRRAAEWDEDAGSISAQKIIEGDPILQV